jgi:hypothetical protein
MFSRTAFSPTLISVAITFVSGIVTGWPRRPSGQAAVRRSAARLPDKRVSPDGQGGPKEKARDNLAAIRTLRLVEDEGRDARDSEKALLVRYSGWGALANIFHPYPRSDCEDIARDVKEHLTPEEYDSARASTPNAHFTSPMVIQALWQALERFGLTPGANILEPSLGVGHFLRPDARIAAARLAVWSSCVTARTLFTSSAPMAHGMPSCA